PLLLSARVGGTLTDPTVVADVATMAAPAVPIAQLSGSLGAGATAQALLPRGLLQELLPTGAAPALGFVGNDVSASAAISTAGAWTAELRTEAAPELAEDGAEMLLEVTANGSAGAALEYQGQLRLLGVEGVV